MAVPIASLTALSVVTPVVTIGQTLSIDSTIFPYVINADLNTSQIEFSIYNAVVANQNPVVVGTQNQFAGQLILDGTVPEALIQIVGRNYDPLAVRPNLTAVPLGFRISDSNGNVQVVTTAGTTGASAPVWATLTGAATTDGTGSTAVVWTNLGPIAITPPIKFDLLYFNSQMAVVVAPPSGVTSLKGQNSATLQWVTPAFYIGSPPVNGFIGVRVQISTDPAGINPPYAQFGGLVSDISSSENSVLSSSTSSQVLPGTTTITTVQTTETVNFSSVQITPDVVNNATIFYAMLSTVIQDPQTNIVYESQQIGPVTCGFVNLKVVSPTDFLALQRKEDIAGRLISQVTRLYPNLDLTPRSEARDLFIDPFATELSNMSVREWFSRISASVSALSQIDNTTGNGISDPFNQSPVKQQLSRAYGLNAADTQTLIDNSFNTLGEQAGVTRGGATQSTVTLTFYTYVRPTQSLTIPIGVIVSTVPDTETPALNFLITSSATLDTNVVDSFYDPVNGWWSLRVAAQCQTAGSIGNVGAGTIRQVLAGAPAGWNVTNLTAAGFGIDIQINSSFAAQIQDRVVTGVDSGTRNGYLVAARSTPGIIGALVVAAGDLEMLRDWDPIRQKHVFGTVDIYVRGTTISEQSENVFFSYLNSGVYGTYSSYLTCNLVNRGLLKFAIQGFSSLAYLPYTVVEMLVSRASNSFYFGTKNAQFDEVSGSILLSPSELAYQYTGDNVTQIAVPLIINGVPATNQVALQAITGALAGTYTFQLLVREQSPLVHVPVEQPVLTVSSVSGPQTGLIDPSLVHLIHSSDFFLEGLSNNAGDQVAVYSSTSVPQTVTVTALTSGSVTIDSGMDVAVNQNGVVQNVLSVRSTDLSTLYTYGVDYTIVPTGRYRTYGLQLIIGGAIANLQQVVVGYNKFVLREILTLNGQSPNQEQVTMNGTLPSILAVPGFVHNTWLPESYGNTTLSLDGAILNPDGTINPLTSTGLVGALVPHDSRYIKVTFNNGVTDVVQREGIDFTLTVDLVSGVATLARILTGHIPDGGVVKVTYFTVETFGISTQIPAYVEQLATAVGSFKHAAADVLIKAMLANPVDVTMTVQLEPNAAAETLDPQIRTVISIVFNNAVKMLTQSEMIAQVQAITGVASIQLPLTKFAKSDGAYDVGVVIPTQTNWVPLTSDGAFANVKVPPNSYITSTQILPDATIPSGGTPDGLVSLLYEGQAFRRAMSIQDFLSNSAVPSFYIIGINDEVSGTQPLPFGYEQKILITEPAVATPALRSYFVTYQVEAEGGTKDIVLSSTEYAVPGVITINYISGS